MIQGIGASDGIAIGKVYKYEPVEVVIKRERCQDVKSEQQKFKDSIQAGIEALEVLKSKTENEMDEETAAIFGAHIEILRDPELAIAVSDMIASEKVKAEFALKTVSDRFVAIFEAMEDAYIRERAADIKDVTRRVLMILKGIKSKGLSEIDEPIILVAKDLTPSDTALLNRELVLGFITDIGGRTSHSAIMARTMEIPAVVGTMDGFDQLSNGDFVILDGMVGSIIIHPSSDEIEKYTEKVAILNREKSLWQSCKGQKSTTKDFKDIDLAANIGSPDDIDGVIANDGDGIGLYRTEFLYMGRKSFPTEEEQYESYKTVLEKMGDKPVVVRTLDIGGDKELSYFDMPKELNPFLGNRALRLCLQNMDMFKTQLRALLRAANYGNLHIMFPMIATIEEFRKAKAVLQEVESDLETEQIPFSKNYQTGIMIEIPAAALLANVFAKEVDFFSIGTNDLIQYTFAADRMNEHVSYLYQPYNPSLLKLIQMVTEAAHKEGKWVGMCGEMAGENQALPLLIGLGLDELSMSAPSILKARYSLKQIDSIKAKGLADMALQSCTEEEVKLLIDAFWNEV
ncbi:phosphotransferase system (PTS) enzyme I [Petrocella atlantisensis]|uniref:Phosphoenolpyruvate-protein phosphotransferase n=1 Tax=Petrocella atlantisensis TaxID=2173034 RepID=A0A3P7P0S6_9FIRM|nr:phosphoenolpyruvate--protein phosphotransferase [Petrocella atlantisensis]PKM56204.1 MAG: phosphoenolpyruvate--protein phosphotransferase [Firmicutes bacterium HGW-Firmicutes-5]VDN48795.1 phosphotransferase system (PTS) enzyme I [Petrocella atlantisensis]